ncbi:predicted protein [Postia placenta Mad-698-R]|nr:predicted protein [Postia placenta Mad-698-R]
MGQEVETEVPRAAEAGLYTGEDEGRLCALVRAQLVRAQYADAAPGAADRSGYGDLELRNKYLSGIPSRVYHKIELETFTMWQGAEEHITEVEQILDISWAQHIKR